MAGSDLDGDEYVVIWDKDLFFPGPNHKAMTFRDHTVAKTADGNLEEAMIQFICNYVKNDNIGVMSNAHLAWADQLEDGIFSDRCLKIADKISVCLDFAKTGAASHLDKQEKPPLYPDFMEKGCHKNTYRSKRILGQLYRLHRSLEAVVSTDFQNHFVESDCQSKLFEYPGWQDFKDSAERALVEYALQMQRILDQHGIRSEGEVVAGLVNKVSDINRSKKERDNVEELVTKQYQHLVKSTRQRFFESVDAACKDRGVSTDVERNAVLLGMISAWYMVTYGSSGEVSDTKRRSCSFPWALADALLELVKALSPSHDAKACHKMPKNFLVSKINMALTKETEEEAEEAESTAQTSAEDLAFKVVTKWAVKDELLKRSKSKHSSVCEPCLSHIFKEFVKGISKGQQQAAVINGFAKEVMNGCFEEAAGDASYDSASFTVGDLVLEFLKHLCGTDVKFPPCDQCKWSSSMTRTITMAAVRTYNLLAITRDLCHLGLSCEPKLHEPVQIVQEGNPIRIQVQHPEFMKLLRHSPEEVEELLRDWSGVQEVHIRGDTSHGGHYLLVSAVGRDWQRWFLQELVLQPWLGEAVEKKDMESFLAE
uniref:RNA-dependent RNA polymerase n=1 Tax=Amblyomma aureolatum TaxID=187763 RepID=A0A1E1X720_9ACAR